MSQAGQSARPRPGAQEGARLREREPGRAVPSAPTCPLALAGEAPAASSAVTSPRGALELWLPMMGVCWGRPEPPRARAAGDSSAGSAWPAEGWGSRLRGRGIGGNRTAPPLRASHTHCARRRSAPRQNAARPPGIYMRPELGAGPDI